jgi:glucosamine--fructose-6-phosphate aminotransferase (isomerizing)
MTLMEQEAFEAPLVIEKQLQENEKIFQQLAKHLKARPPTFAMTIARGSSDHACTFAKYLLETQLGLVTASGAPSTLTLYNSRLHLKNALVIGISQSGKSPDICEMMTAAKNEGAITVALVNNVDSPLAKMVDFLIPLHAGEEKAVAATKSYLASLAALIQLTAHITEDPLLLTALKKLPAALQLTLEEDWSAILTELKSADDILVLARGYGFPIAQEAALKFKEILSLHAEAFSSAEVLHGPFGLIKKDFPLLMFTQNDASLSGMLELAKKSTALGAKVLLSTHKGLVSTEELKKITPYLLSLPTSLHPICDPLMAIQAFYPAAARLAIQQGFNPDAPANLKKVTETR